MNGVIGVIDEKCEELASLNIFMPKSSVRLFWANMSHTVAKPPVLPPVAAVHCQAACLAVSDITTIKSNIIDVAWFQSPGTEGRRLKLGSN